MTKPTVRNAFVTWLVPMLCFAAMPVLGNFLGQTAFRFAPNAAMLAGVFIMFIHFRAMTAEMNAITGNSFVFWPFLVPVYNLYWGAVLLPAEMAKAKEKAGKGKPRSTAVYLFLPLYAFAADLNDIAT